MRNILISIFLLIAVNAYAIGSYTFVESESDYMLSGDADVNGDITMQAWVNVAEFPTVNNTINTVIQKTYVAPEEPYYIRIQQLSGSDYIECGMYDNDLTADSKVSWAISGWAAGEWHHLACTCTDSTKVWEFFFDGVSVASSPAQSNCATLNNGNVNIGRSNIGSPARYFDGKIAHVKVHAAVLSDEQIVESMNCINRHVDDALLYLPLWEPTTQVDLTGNGYDATNNGASASTDGAPVSWCGNS